MPTWGRSFYQPGGGDAILDYVAFGRFAQPIELSMGAYHTAGVPDFVDVAYHTRPDDPERFDGYLHGYAADWLRANDASQFSTVRLCEDAIEITGRLRDPSSLNYLRDVIGILAGLMDLKGVAVLDRLALRWWRPAEWKEQVWKPKTLNVPALINTVVSRADGDVGWTVSTRGMRKFGRPDVRLRETPQDQTRTAVDVVNRMASMLAQGAIVPNGKIIKTPAIPGDLVCRLDGGEDDPAFQNAYVDIVYPAAR